MNKYYISIIIFLIFYSIDIQGQTISGIVLDEKQNPLEFASILLLNKSDSTMISFANSNEKGEFFLNADQTQNALLQITFMGYETFWMDIPKERKSHDVGKISLQISDKVLNTIVIKDNLNPMIIGKDTVQYTAAAFKLKTGDMVEDLIKKLPGMEVERDGSIKAFGEKVENVLVDGKTFFGKDTKVATKNLDADAVDKVQVFDKKSEKADFTGVQDGSRERSINLKLKEDKKNGYFGTTEVAGGTDERFKARANINHFTPTTRTSFIGMANNINEQNFSISDYIDFMGGIGSFMSGGSGSFSIDLSQNSGLPIGLANNQGIQKSYAGGLNLNTNLFKSTSLDGSIFMSSFRNNLDIHTLQENQFSSTSFTNENTDNQLSNNGNAAFNIKTKTKIDSFQNIIFKLNGNIGNNSLKSISNSFSTDYLQNKLNSNQTVYQLAGINAKIKTDLIWQRRFAKKGRSIFASTVLNYYNNDNSGILSALNTFNFPDFYNSLIHQNQNYFSNNFDYQFEGSFTEPLGKKQYLEMNGLISNQTSTSYMDYLDIINESPIKNYLLSTVYQRDYLSKNLGLTYSINREKYNFSIGSKYEIDNLIGSTKDSLSKIKVNYSAIIPNLHFNYQFGMGNQMNFNYSAALNAPTIRQLQPNIDNSNPLSIYKGNPSLKPEYVHTTDANYMKYNSFNFTMLYTSLRINYIQNKINESIRIDSTLARTFMPLNTRNELNLNGRIEYNFPIRPLRLLSKITLKGAYSNGYTVVNESINNIVRPGYGVNFSLENRKKDILDIVVGIKYNKSLIYYSESEKLNQSYQDYTIYNESNININDWISVNSRIDYTTYIQSFSKDAVIFPLWNLTITSYVNKAKKLRLYCSVFDLLNQNKGIQRNSNLNYIQVSKTNVLGRYFMIGLSYNIKGFKKNSGLEIKVGS